MNHLLNYIDGLLAKGECTFTSRQALDDLPLSVDAFRMSLLRLRKKQQIITVAQGFHLILMPEYRKLGCLPAPYFVPQLMRYLKQTYYGCLLTAAKYHGATHQVAQVFQVMVNRQIKKIQCRQTTIEFVYKKELPKNFLQSIDVSGGRLIISTPELTAQDLLMYPKKAGGLQHVLTVLTELIDVMDANRLKKLLTINHSYPWVQRLGFLLDQAQPLEEKRKKDCLDVLEQFLQEERPPYIPLVGNSRVGNRNKKWKIIENITLESDI